MTESAEINTQLTKNAVEIRQIVQDFPLCSTFKEIDEQNALGNNLTLSSVLKTNCSAQLEDIWR